MYLMPMLVAASFTWCATPWRPLEECVPANAMAAYFGRPSPGMLDAPPGGTMDQLAGWMMTLKAMGVIPAQGRVLADVLGTMPLLSRRPHVVAMMDVTSRRIQPDIYRLRSLQVALVIDSKGIERQVDRRLRDLLMTYTSSETGTIETLKAGEITYHRLADKRLPAWAETEWGMVGDQFLVGFGSGAFMTMLDTMEGRSPALGRDAWYRQAHARCHGATSGIELYVDFARIRARVGEVVEGRPEEVLRSLHLEDVERLLWTIGFDGRALRSEAMARQKPGIDRYLMLAGKEIPAPEVTALIPEQASHYAAFRFPLPDAIRRARAAYFDSMSGGKQDRISDGWDRTEQAYAFDAEAGLVDQLGEHVVFHTYPPHPLGVPILFTIWVQIRGDAALVSRTIDGMMNAWQTTVNPLLPQSRPALTLSPRVARDPSGIWYLQLGLAGPAVAVAEGWLVISYSPEAVRDNLAYLESRGHARIAAPSTAPATP